MSDDAGMSAVREARAPRRRPRGLKVDLFKWVEDQQQLDMRTKYILEKLACFAQPDCTSWAPVSTLAYAANCSDRTVQYHLRALEEEGLIRPTGRLQRLENSSRSVPIYQLAPGVEGLGAPEGMGAILAPMGGSPRGEGGPMGAEIAPIDDPAWVQCSTSMGATGLHPVNETQETLSGDKSPSPGAREALFAELEQAVPKPLLRYADRGVAFVAFCALLDQGVTPDQLAAAARRMAADPAFRSRKYPPPLEDWLSKGQWRGWDADDPAPAVPPASGWAGPAELRAAVVAAADEAFARSYLDTARWVSGPPPRLVVRSTTARQRLEQRVRDVLTDFQVIVEREGA